MHNTSIFNVKVDLGRSHGTYLYDLNRRHEVLDLFGNYSSLPLGYGHPVFDAPDFTREVLEHTKVKLPNCEMRSEAAERFYADFTSHSAMKPFKYFHFCCTGALAVEAAVKAAMLVTGQRRVLTHRDNFHGINGYGGLLAAPDGPAWRRLHGLSMQELAIPLQQVDGAAVDFWATRVDRLAAVLIEPIQCTMGDTVMPVKNLIEVRAACTRHGVPLIFDEIQTGFGGTGTLWYFEQLGIVPDIVIFGKKSQVSGIMVREGFGKIFEYPARLEVTWDGDVIDMIRCRAILQAYEKERILENVKLREAQLSWLPGLRHVGLLMALDFGTRLERDEFVRYMWREEHTIMIPTGELTVRWRPNLALTKTEAQDIIARTTRAYDAVAA